MAMNKQRNLIRFVGTVMAGMIITANAQAGVQNTICFSKTELTRMGNRILWQGSLGDDIPLHGGKCNGKKLAQMNKEGWSLIQVVGGIESAFGMVFQKGK